MRAPHFSPQKEKTMKMRNLFLSLALALIAMPVLATNPHSANGYSGSAGGYATSYSTGSAGAQSEVNGTGFSANFASQATGGAAGAFGGGSKGTANVGTYTTSFGTSAAGGVQFGNASGGAGAGGGTDVEAKAWADFGSKYKNGR
jgi:hypothetical protein